MPRRKAKDFSSPRAPLSPSPPRPRRKEWLAIALITLLAAGLRLAFPGRMAIEHFDEGVYASNIFFSAAQGGAYPYRFLYAPPLLPWLIEWGIIFLGPESIAPFLPALVLGIATVPLMWWVGRSWFGPGAGLAAALLVATSEFHILYSRAALTDVPVMFFIVLAVFLYFEAVRWESIKWSLWAGVATGLAWWTKYTGWLPLAIALTASLAWIGITWCWRAPDVSPGGRLAVVAKCFATMALTAIIVFSPVFFGLQEHGGYAAVAANHAGYLISQPLGWFENVYQQWAKSIFASGVVTSLGLALVAGVIPLLKSRRRWWNWAGAVTLALGVYLATDALGPVVTMAAFAVWGLLLEAFWRLRHRRDEDDTALPLWLLAAWLVGMSLTTPLYTPYPRMMFPWLFAVMLLCSRWLAQPAKTAVPRDGWSRPGTLVVVFLILVPGIAISVAKRTEIIADVVAGREDSSISDLVKTPLWADRTGVRDTAEKIAKKIKTDSPKTRVVYVPGQPALYFHLRALLAQRNAVVVPVGSTQGLSAPPETIAYLVVLYRPLTLPKPRGSSIYSPPGLAAKLTTPVGPLVALDRNIRVAPIARVLPLSPIIPLFRFTFRHLWFLEQWNTRDSPARSDPDLGATL